MSDLTPNHNPGAPLQPIDKEGLAKLAQKNIDNPEGGWIQCLCLSPRRC